MSGKSIMNKFVIRNIVQLAVHCTYVCVFYLMLLSLLDTAGIGADKMPQEDISVVTEVDDELAPNGSSGVPTEDKGLLSSDIGFVHAFAASFMVIIVSELGDKTFFIAAIMAMRHPRLTVFAGAIAALALMTVLSVVFGMAATIIPRVYTFYISTALFALFGLKMLKDGYYMSATDAAEELEEVQSDLRKRDDELARSMSGSRKETVELVPLSETEDDSKQQRMMLPRNGATHRANGSVHSLAEPGTIEGGGPSPTAVLSTSSSLRLSASASQLHPGGHHHHHHSPASAAAATGGPQVDGLQSSQQKFSVRKTKGISTMAGDGAIKSTDNLGGAGETSVSSDSVRDTLAQPPATVTLLENGGGESEQRQRLRGGGGGGTANGSIASGATDQHHPSGAVVGAGSTLGGSKMLEREVSASGSLMKVQDAETGATRRGTRPRNLALRMLFRIFAQAFTMTFLAEWGDRSQLTTIILSARENVYGVIAGGIIGHSICTGLAVIGGRMIAQRISVRTVTLIGGVVFLLFAVSALFFGPGEEEPAKVPFAGSP
ncbi:uncharacterized protein LOC128269142 [Anopheles cruzii]|uniref:uncharacterized protein LOC128269142 n=1 Tax=Anopheles cruzii TaxID=68878 RepID=UPI0022EC824A|nr:uncharacterized protein LOC128269142 [Anopheles cruzii]